MWILHSGFIALIAASQNPISMILYSLPARFVFFLVRKKLRTSWENHRVGNTVIESQKCGFSGGGAVCVQPLSSDSWYRLHIFMSAWDRSPSQFFWYVLVWHSHPEGQLKRVCMLCSFVILTLVKEVPQRNLRLEVIFCSTQGSMSLPIQFLPTFSII